MTLMETKKKNEYIPYVMKDKEEQKKFIADIIWKMFLRDEARVKRYVFDDGSSCKIFKLVV